MFDTAGVLPNGLSALMAKMYRYIETAQSCVSGKTVYIHQYSDRE